MRSKTFKKHELNMGITEKEMAAVIFGVRELRHFLIGKSLLRIYECYGSIGAYLFVKF